MKWEDTFEHKPGRGLIQYLRNVCRDIAYQTASPHMLLQDRDPSVSILMKPV